MKTLTLVLFTLLVTLSVKAQTQEELAKAQQEYAQIFAKMMNCDTLEKTLLIQYKMLKEQGLVAEQLAEMKKGIDLQIKQCKDNKTLYGGSGAGTKPNNFATETTEENNKENDEALPTQKPPFNTIEMPSAYQITYQIKDGEDMMNMDIFLSAENANYGIMTKDPESGENFYSIYKEANKRMYMIGEGTIISYDFAKFQKSSQNLTPSREEMSKYNLKPSGATETIAGYLCKELTGKTDDGSILKLWVAYGIKSGCLVMPGARYRAEEKALYKQFYGSEELGFFLKAVTVSSEGTTTLTASSVKKNPAQITIDVSQYNYYDASNLFSNPNK